MTTRRAQKADSLPEATLLYDRDCGICNRAVAWISKRSRKLHTAGFQSVDTEDFGVSAAQASEEVWLFEDDGGVSAGGFAVSRLLQRSQFVWWRALGYFLAVPPMCSLTAAGYRLVAKNRHRISRALRISDRRCALPTSENKNGSGR